MNFRTTAATVLLGLSVSISSFSPALAQTQAGTLSPEEIRGLFEERCTADKKLFITYESYDQLSDLGMNISYNYPNGGEREDYALLRCSEGRFIRNYTAGFKRLLAACPAGKFDDNQFFIPANNPAQWDSIMRLWSIGLEGKPVPATAGQATIHNKVFGFPAKYRGVVFTCTPTTPTK